MKFFAANNRRRDCLPLALLLLAISTIYLFGDGWSGFYNYRHGHDWNSAKNMAIAENLSPAHNFLMFLRQQPSPDGTVEYAPYNRFPIGGFALIKLAAFPFGDDLSTKLYAGRMLMLLMLAGAAALSYLSLRRITADRRIAFAATLLAFSAYHILYFSDMVSNEITMDLFAIMLVFHGMTVFVQEGRFRQLLVKTCLALLIGWHVYALLLPFIIFGLCRETIRTWRWNAPGSAIILRIRSAAAALVRSRYMRLGLTALMFGLAVLGFGLINEYAALGGETPFREISSVQSIEKRTGQSDEYNAYRAELVAWGPFLSEQARRIGRMSLPYAITVHTTGLPYASSSRPLSPPYAALGIGTAAACLVGLLFLRRHRKLLAALSLVGLIWGLGLPLTTALHNFEGVFFVGIFLTLYTLILLALRLWRRIIPTVIATAALPLFILSAYQMAQTQAQVQALAVDNNTAVMSDFLAMRPMMQGKKVYLQLHELDPYIQEIYHIIDYYLTGTIFLMGEKPISDCGPQCGRYYDFVISGDRNLFPAKHLLTPSNREAFLFDTGNIDADAITAEYRSEYEAITSGAYGAPMIRAEYDLYVSNNKAIYYKNHCNPVDTANLFFLHTIPDDANDLSDERQEYGFDNLDFSFLWRGATFDGNCLAIVPLPDYPIANIRAGQFVFAPDRTIWGAVISLKDPVNYNVVASAIAAGAYGEPAARNAFNVYRGETELVYHKDPCDDADITAQFYLHLIPQNESDLPPQRQKHGFDNLDFSFWQSGVLTGGQCLTIAPLPDYPIASIRTGQFIVGDGQRLWAAEFPGKP